MCAIIPFIILGCVFNSAINATVDLTIRPHVSTGGILAIWWSGTLFMVLVVYIMVRLWGPQGPQGARDSHIQEEAEDALFEDEDESCPC
jgi:hypothetical protein